MGSGNLAGWNFDVGGIGWPHHVAEGRPLTGQMDLLTTLRFLRAGEEQTVEERIAEIAHDLDDRCLCRDCCEFKALQYRLRGSG